MRQRQFAAILIGSDALMREGLRRVLTAAGFRILASTSTIHELVLDNSAQRQPDLLIIDGTDDLCSAVEQIELFKLQHPASRVAMISHRHQIEDLISAFRAGANACFGEMVTCDGFTKVLELVMLGHTVLPPELLTIVSNLKSEHDCFKGEIDAERIRGASLSIKIDDVPRLSDREKRVLQLLIEGASNKAIGRKINAAEGTVKVHVKAILRKIRARNRTQAAIWAMNNGSLIGRTDLSAPLVPEGNIDFAVGQQW